MIAIAKPFVEGLRRRELLLPWCKGCGKPHFYPRTACPHCWGEEYEWKKAKGTATIHTFAVVRANPPSAFRDLMPFTIAILDLAEGVRMLSNVVGEAKDLSIGDTVQLAFVERNGANLPLFRRVP